MTSSTPFLPLLLVLFLAVIVPLLLSKVRWMPFVVGEILVGIVIGRSGFKLIGTEPTLDFLSEIGLAFLMFLAGLEIDFSQIIPPPGANRKRSGPILIAGIVFLLTLGLSVVLGRVLVSMGISKDPWMLGLILSTTSLGVVVPVLKERELISMPYGQTLMLSAILADFFTMFLITIYVTVSRKGLSLDILLVGILFVAAGLIYKIGLIRIKKTGINRFAARSEPSHRRRKSTALLLS